MKSENWQLLFQAVNVSELQISVSVTEFQLSCKVKGDTKLWKSNAHINLESTSTLETALSDISRFADTPTWALKEMEVFTMNTTGEKCFDFFLYFFFVFSRAIFFSKCKG